MKKKASTRRLLPSLTSVSFGALMLGFAAVSAQGQTADIYNSNTGDQTTAVNGTFMNGPWSGSTPPVATSAVQINSVLAGNGNQTITYDITAGSTIFSLNINEDVAGISNLLSETAAFGASNTANNLLVFNASSGNALSISATGGGTGAVAGLSFTGNSTNTSNAQTVLGLGGSNGAIVLNATTGNTAQLVITSSTPTATGMTAINLGGTSTTTAGSLTIGNGGGGTSLVSLTGDNSGTSFPGYNYITSYAVGGVYYGQVNINANGKLVVGSTTNTGTAFVTNADNSTTVTGLETGYVRANVTMNGGTLEVANTGSGALTSQNMNLSGSLTATAGSLIQLDQGKGSTTNTFTTLNIGGNASLTGTTLNTVAAATSTNGLILLSGATNTLTNTVFQINGTTATTTSAATFGPALEFAGTTNQSLTSNTPIFGLIVRGGAVASASLPEGNIKTLTLPAPTTAGNIGGLIFGAGGATLTTTLRLGSDLTSYAGVTTANNFALLGSTPGTQILDLAGHTYDATNVTGGLALINAGNPTWYINSFDATQTNAVAGTVRARYFNFANTSTGTINVGAGVTLVATTSGTTNGAAVTNNLGGSTGTAGTPGTIDRTSTFVYTGSDGALVPTSGFYTYLSTGSRTTATPIGGITVGDPTSANISAIRLGSNVFAAGNVTVNTGSAGNTTSTAGNNILNLGGLTLTLQGSASLLGNGTVTGNSGGISNVAWASGSAGGLSPGTTGTVGMLTMTSNGGGFVLNMTNAGNSQFDIASTSSYDQINRGVGTTGTAISIVYGGKLTLNFLNPVANGTTTYQLFAVNNSTQTGTFSDDASLLANAMGNTTGITSITFSEATGQLTVMAAVPEPSTIGLLGGMMLVGCVARAYYRRRSAV